MADIGDINDAIASAATGPAEVEVGDERVRARTIKEMLDAAAYVAAQSAADNCTFGFRTKALKGGGAWQ